MVQVGKTAFLDRLIIGDCGDGLWLVHEPLRFYSARLTRTFKVPQGTVTDLASIPVWVQVIGAILGLILPLPRNLLSRSGRYNRAAVLHDAAYNDRLVDVHGIELRVTKRLADTLFLDAMLADRVPQREAKAVYLAVKLFGRPSVNMK